ncbi:MAG: hypothetical protein AAGU18_10670 [Proteiniphilum sp.]
MKTAIYFSRKTFNHFDNERYLLYLNEEIIQNYVPEDAPEGVEPVTAYSYTGTEEDGGTLITATEQNYEAFVSGLIRTRYSADQVEAILLNVQSSNPDRMPEFLLELDQLNAFREECKQIAAGLLQ